MKLVGITVAAASRLLLRRAHFSPESGSGLIPFMRDGLLDRAKWGGFAITEAIIPCVGVPRDSGEAILVIDRAVFADVDDDDEVAKIADRALRVFVTIARGSSLNPSWHSFKTGSLLSVFANPNKEDKHRRICFELAAKADTGVVALYAIMPLGEVADLASSPPSQELKSAIEKVGSGLRSAAATAEPIPIRAGVARPAIIEDHRADTQYRAAVAGNIGLGRTYEEWLPQLDQHQVEFVKSEVRGPVRLHGAAGTGKTLCLLLKALSQVGKLTGEERVVIFAHSATMRDALAVALDSLDPDRAIRGRGRGRVALEVRTLFDWCIEFLGQELEPAQILDQDATESREFQLEILGRCISETISKEWPAHKPQCSPGFRRMIEAESQAPWLRVLLAHEIGCVLKGNRIQPFRIQAYLDLKRPGYALPLVSEGDRRFVFLIYKAYEEELKEYGVFDVDDVTVEVLSRLESPLWSRQRQGRGYDYVFIDEAHLTNENDRSLLLYLMRNPFELPHIVMALDLLQLVGDAGVSEDTQGRLVTPTATSSAERTEFSEVHRSSQEILDLAQAVVSGGSELYEGPLGIDGSSLKQTGQKPEMFSAPDVASLVKLSFEVADRWRKSQKWSRHDIALVCATRESMSAMLEYGEKTNKPIRVVDLRGDQEARSDAERFSSYVVVTPEYSAGLQFKGVILVDVSEGRVPESGSAVPGARAAMRRRAVSEIYLALTRASERVAVLVDSTSGPSDLLVPAIESGTLVDAV